MNREGVLYCVNREGLLYCVNREGVLCEQGGVKREVELFKEGGGAV